MRKFEVFWCLWLAWLTRITSLSHIVSDERQGRTVKVKELVGRSVKLASGAIVCALEGTFVRILLLKRISLSRYLFLFYLALYHEKIAKNAFPMRFVIIFLALTMPFQ